MCVRRKPLGLLVAFLILSAACTSEERTVSRDFSKEHPNYSIVSIGSPDGHGGSTVVTCFIRYRKPNDTREYWSDWAYETKDGRFDLVGKGAEHLFEPDRK